MRIKRRKTLSYTLVELLTIVAILGIMVGGALPLWSTFAPRRDVETSAFKLFNDLQQAWQFSRSLKDEHRFYGIRLYDNLVANDGSGRSGYKIFYFHGATIIDPPALPITNATNRIVVKSSIATDNPEFLEDTFFSRGVIISPASGIVACNDTVLCNSNTIIFTSQGSATTNGTLLLVLGTNNFITLSKGGYSRTITISPLTGYIQD